MGIYLQLSGRPVRHGRHGAFHRRRSVWRTSARCSDPARRSRSAPARRHVFESRQPGSRSAFSRAVRWAECPPALSCRAVSRRALPERSPVRPHFPAGFPVPNRARLPALSPGLRLMPGRFPDLASRRLLLLPVLAHSLRAPSPASSFPLRRSPVSHPTRSNAASSSPNY